MSHLWKSLGLKVVPALFVLAFFVPLTFSFAQPGNTVEIWEIQGAGHLSPLEGETVSTTGNIVTVVIGSGSNKGFYMQTPTDRDDHDDDTSNAIFVFTGSQTPNVAP